MDDARRSIVLPATIAEAGRRLRERTLTAEALTRACLGCIRKLQPVLNAFITVTEEQALETAAALDRELAAGTDRGPLHGIPICHKDNIATAGVPTTVGSEYFRHRVPDEDAAMVKRLEAAGAVSLGKTNMSEFASGSSGVNVFYGNVRNPWDLGRAPGGSSSGTAVAVAAGLCLAGTGTDSGGSIRQPAARCGIVGIRPTFGRVSLTGVWPRTRTLGAGGPMARTVADVAVVLNAMAGYDPNYPPSLDVPGEDFTAELDKGVRGVRLGLVEDFTFRDVDAEIAEAIHGAADTLASLGAEVRTVKIPALSGALEYSKLFGNVLLYEFNQILGEHYRAAPRELFGPAIHADMARGAQVAKETYERILAERPAQVREVKRAFAEVDALLTPVLPNLTPLQSAGPGVWARGRQFNLPFSFAGVPAISVPCGFARGMPVGLQVVANDLQERLLLRIAAAFEAATGFHRRRPPLCCAGAEP